MAELGPAVLELEAPQANSAGIGVRTGDHELRAWVTEIGGPRLFEVPAEAILDATWSKGLDKTSSATVVIDRYHKLEDESWLQNRFQRVVTEVQIGWDGLIRAWGPVLDRARTPGSEACQVKTSGWPYWYGCRLVGDEQPTWSREWLVNPQFADDLAGWTTQGTPTLDTGDFETGTQSVQLEDGDAITQRVWVGQSGEYQLRVWVRAKVPEGVDDTSEAVRVWATGVADTFQTRQVWGDAETHTAWTWVIVDATVRHAAGAAPKGIHVQVSGGPGGTVKVDQVMMQISPAHLPGGGRGGQTRARQLSQRLAFQSLVNVVGPDFNIRPAATLDGRTINAPWANRPDVFASEGFRQLTDADEGVEHTELNTDTDRIDLMSDLIGVQHDPEDVTLRVRIAGGPGNCSLIGPINDATGRPVSEMIVMGEEQFWGSYRDETAYDGKLLQDLAQAPTGTPTSELDRRAKHELEAGRADDLSTVLTLVVEDLDVASLLDVGDRVHLVLDDGPDQIDDLVRIQSGEWAPLSAQPLKITVVPWVEP